MRNLAPGTRVRSTYRARWVGVVVERLEDTSRRRDCYLVQPTHTRDGRPQPKCQRPRVLNRAWLEVV